MRRLAVRRRRDDDARVTRDHVHRIGYLDHLEDAIRLHFSGCSRVAFVPYALADHDGYGATAEARFGRLGIRLQSVHRQDAPARAVSAADGIFIGGGNTFRLLDRLHGHRLIGPIRELVAAGGPYLGTSAGSNVAGPTILTTNDWNVVGLDRFDALGLVGFNINPHYKETDPTMASFSETRDDRIREYHVVNANPVLGLEEGAWVMVDDASVTAHGTARVKLFRPAADPVWYQAGDRLPVT